MATDPALVETKKGVLLSVHAHPGAGSSTIVGRHGTALKIRVGAPPADGRANEALTTLVAKEFGLAKDAVEVVSGATSRSKRLSLGDLDAAAATAQIERILAGNPLR